MSSALTHTNETRPPAGLRQANRSGVLGLFRTNPFRVLRVRPDIGVDEAIWKSEESLTRLRAGLPLPDGELLPWLADPDEPEIRQAVQRIEEPLRRLCDEVFWFDPRCDPDGELLRRALAGLEPGLLDDYLARITLEDLPVAPTVTIDLIAPIVASTADAAELTGEADPAAAGPEAAEAPDASEVPRFLNQANLRLLLASLSLYDALPHGFRLGAPQGGAENGMETIAWKSSHGLETAANPHELALTTNLAALRANRVVSLWSEALAYWLRLIKAPAFLAFVHAGIARLEDDVVGADDAEVIIKSVMARLTDLVVGEVKAQLLAGRIDRVRSLLEAAASSELEPRRWIAAFRPLRPLFRTEAAELEPLLALDDPAFNDSALYLSRLGTLRARWELMDHAGFLGLDVIGDEAVVKACESLAALESHAAVDRLKPLYGKALSLASAESLKQRIASVVSRLNGFDLYTCHFCRTREMDLQRSVVVTGKQESHRTYGFNSTTIHYMIKADIIRRCSRCCELHLYLWHVTSTVRGALAVAVAAGIGFLYWTSALGPTVEPAVYVVLAAVAAAMVWPAGVVARWIATLCATPRGERRYWRARDAKQYKEMHSSGCQMTLDYRPNAFPTFKAAHPQ